MHRGTLKPGIGTPHKLVFRSGKTINWSRFFPIRHNSSPLVLLLCVPNLLLVRKHSLALYTCSNQ